jgi:hypothetical protein
MTRWFIGLLLATFSSLTAYSQAPLDEIVVADGRIPDSAHAAWSTLPAVFVSAPDSTKHEMDGAIEAAVKTNNLLCLREGSCAWLKIQSRRVYLQGLSGSGKLSKDGMLCPSSRTIPQLKYYSTRFIVRRKCLPVFWDKQAQTYSVSDR